MYFDSSGRIALTVLRCLLGAREAKMDGIIQFLVASVKRERAYMSHMYGNTLFDCMRLSIMVSTKLMNPLVLHDDLLTSCHCHPFVLGFSSLDDAILGHGTLHALKD